MASNDVSTVAAAPAPQEAIVGSKRKAEEVAEEGHAVGAGEETKFVPAVGESFVDEATGIEYVDMPESYLAWILSQKRLSPSPYDPRECTAMSPEEMEREVAAVERLRALQAGVQDEFFAFQAWVRETYETKGRVLVPVESIPDEFAQENE